jgi:hypothetical protein
VQNGEKLPFLGSPFFSHEGKLNRELGKIMAIFRPPANGKWKMRKQACFLPLRVWIWECHLGGSNWFVLGEEHLPFIYGVDEKLS